HQETADDSHDGLSIDPANKAAFPVHGFNHRDDHLWRPSIGATPPHVDLPWGPSSTMEKGREGDVARSQNRVSTFGEIRPVSVQLESKLSLKSLVWLRPVTPEVVGSSPLSSPINERPHPASRPLVSSSVVRME